MKFAPFILIVLLLASTSQAELPTPPELRDVGVDEKPGAALPMDLTFINESGKQVKLRDCLIREKPAVLQLGYLGCPMLCETVSQGLLRSTKDLDLNIGGEYSVIYVSFDPTETSTDAYQKKKTYVQQYDRAGSAAGWNFLVGDKVSIDSLCAAVGFKYKWIESNRQFSHPAVLMVLSPDGRVMRYLYGVEFPKQTLQLSLVEASAGKIGSTLDQAIMFCFQYSPSEGRYTFAAMGLMRLGGAMTMIVVAAILVRQYRKERRVAQA